MSQNKKDKKETPAPVVKPTAEEIATAKAIKDAAVITNQIITK